EDGMRYWSVTGVQTCALPICRERALVAVMEGLARLAAQRAQDLPRGMATSLDRRLREPGHHVPLPVLDRRQIADDEHLRRAGDRSEERRVGKEGRGRGGPVRA